MALVVDASVGLKWILNEKDSPLAEALALSEETLLVPDFWLNEACNVLWVQVRRNIFTHDEAREALSLLRAQVEPTPTAALALHDVALEFSLTIDHSPYDTMYLAFAIAMGAEKVIVADRKFVSAMQAYPDPAIAAMLLPLSQWGAAHGL